MKPEMRTEPKPRLGPRSGPRLDRDARREAIIDVAGEIFLDEGYEAASMSAIAARLGGSKGTLYNYFDGKEALFAAYVQRHCAWQEEAMFGLAGDGDLRGALTRLGRRFLSSVLSEFSLRNFRLIVAEAERSPRLGRAFYEAGPMVGLGRLAAFLKAATGRGELRLDDPVAGAHQFIGLCQNRMLKARLCNVMAEPTAAEIERDVAAAVDTFMAAFGAGGRRALVALTPSPALPKSRARQTRGQLSRQGGPEGT